MQVKILDTAMANVCGQFSIEGLTEEELERIRRGLSYLSALADVDSHDAYINSDNIGEEHHHATYKSTKSMVDEIKSAQRALNNQRRAKK